MTLEQRLISIGFTAADSSAAVAAVGDDASLDTAAQWISRRMLQSILTGAGFREVPSTEPTQPVYKPWPPADTADKAYEDGKAASHRDDNPHPLESEEWQAWDDGWNDRDIEVAIADDGYQHDEDDYADRVEWRSRR